MNPQLLEMAMQGQADPQTMMAKMLEDDSISPQKRQLLQMLIDQQQPQEISTEYEDVTQDTTVEPTDTLETKRLVRQAEQRIAELEDLTESLAAALGACTTCFGADPSCETCEGHGTPGHFAPNRAAFEFFVLPVISRMKRPRKNVGPQKAETIRTQQNANLERSA